MLHKNKYFKKNSMAFNTCCKHYNGLVDRKTHSTHFSTVIHLESKKERKKTSMLFGMSSIFKNAAVYNER